MADNLTLSKLFFNTPEEIEIPPFGTIKVRLPTNGDRMKALAICESKPYWNMLKSQDEKDAEFMANLIPFVVVEPQITHEDMDSKIPAPYRNALVEMVLAWLVKKDSELRKKRQNVFDSFFQGLKENQP